jgi:hypothetical protein
MRKNRFRPNSLSYIKPFWQQLLKSLRQELRLIGKPVSNVLNSRLVQQRIARMEYETIRMLVVPTNPENYIMGDFECAENVETFVVYNSDKKGEMLALDGSDGAKLS